MSIGNFAINIPLLKISLKFNILLVRRPATRRPVVQTGSFHFSGDGCSLIVFNYITFIIIYNNNMILRMWT